MGCKARFRESQKAFSQQMNNMRTIFGFFIAVVITAALVVVNGVPTYAALARKVTKPLVWLIGIYQGSSPFKFAPIKGVTNPVMTAKQVTDVKAQFVADPFMIQDDGGKWYLFFEIMVQNEPEWGNIGMAESDDGLHWTYQKSVINEQFGLSYPYVFKWQNDYYLMPESYQAGALRLYKATHFPDQWKFVGNMMKGYFVDSSIIRYNDKWWLFSKTSPENDGTLRLYYADNLLGPWTEHPKSPIIKNNAHLARPGGRIIEAGGFLVRYAQDDKPTYGNKVRAFIITRLTTTDYQEQQATGFPVLRGSGRGWNARGMHTLDPHQIGKNKWLACVDGIGTL